MTWQSLLDWVLRNIRAISLLPLGVAILAVIVKALSMRKEWLSTLVAGLPQLTWQRSSGKESPDFFELIRSALQVGFREVKAFCRSHVKQISILFAITAAVVGAANVALSLSDNEEKAKSAGLKLPDPVCSRKGNTQLLIFIHGWNGDPDATWKKFPALACADPTLTGVDVLVVDYPTYAKRRNLTIAALARWVNEEIRRVESQKAEPAYTKVAIVAHSMGGLIGREIAIIRKLGNQQPIGVSVEIATPHQGADDAGLAHALGMSKELTEEMMSDSATLDGLTSHWDSFEGRPATQCFTSPDDKVVSQQSASSYCDHAQSYPSWGHIEMVKPASATDPRYYEPMILIHKFVSQPRDSASKVKRTVPGSEPSSHASPG